VVVDEYLREWCANAQRTPLVHEQAHIAQVQQQRIEAAAMACPVVIADTTALMTAVYSEWVFADQSLYPQAIAQQRRFDLTLLTGLDMPWQADGIQREGAHVRSPVDSLLRSALDSAGIAYRVVYGLGAARLESAIDCIAACASPDWEKGQKPLKKWTWACDRCSDADCEHRLFSQLTAPS
jgi:nicotinamide riboside kinase